MPPGDIRAASLRKPWHRFLAVGGDTPSYAVMMCTGAARSHGDIRFTCQQPTSVQQAFYLVNGPQAAVDTLEALCTTLTGAGIVRYDANDGTPAVGEVWGPESGSWSIHKGRPGFIIAGGPRTLDDGSTCVVAIQFPGASSSGSITRFRLTADLDIGSSAAAVILSLVGGVYVTGAAITVYDWWGIAAGISTRGMFAGVSGMEGWCSAREDSSGYDVVWMEGYARNIGFSLNEDMGETTEDEATATIDYSFEQGVAPPTSGDLITVHDDQELFPKALAGAKGWAVRNEYLNTDAPGDPYYQVLQCDQMQFRGFAKLTTSMCPDEFRVGIGGFTGWDYAPHGQHPVPEPTEAFNPYMLAAANGRPIKVEWGKCEDLEEDERPQVEGWLVTQAQHIKVDLGGRCRWNSATGCFEQYIIKDCAIMTCDTASEFEEWYCPPVCDV